MNILRTTYDWMGKQAYSPYAACVLGFLFFIEAIFFLPVDPILVIYCLNHENKSWYFATLATVASVAGGIVGYYIGFAFWQSFGHLIIGWLLTQETFDKATLLLKNYEMLAVLIAGFTPVPYKAITYTAGFCKLPLIPFIIYSFIARGARFYLVAYVSTSYGKQIKPYIDRYLNVLVFLFFVLAIGATSLIQFFKT